MSIYILLLTINYRYYYSTLIGAVKFLYHLRGKQLEEFTSPESHKQSIIYHPPISGSLSSNYVEIQSEKQSMYYFIVFIFWYSKKGLSRSLKIISDRQLVTESPR